MRIAVTRVLPRAERQWGVIARWQLVQCGLSDAAISRWVASSRLQRIHPGVYAAGHTAIPLEGRLLAAILYAGPGAALSHASAAHWWQLIPYLPEITHVTSPRRRKALNDVRVHRAGNLERVMHRGLPVTPVARTLLDFAAVASLWQEAFFLDLCRRHRLPFPEVNVKVGPYTVDALWREKRLVVELDGGDGHSSYARMQRDRERDLDLRRSGHSVLRYSWRQVTKRSREVGADLHRALASAGVQARRR
jgi:very-short-patch-repair endonuclease